MQTGPSGPKPLEKTQEEASDALSDALLSLSLDGIWILDREGRVRDVNDALCRLLGREAVDILGHEVYGFLPADMADLARRRLSGTGLRPQPTPTPCRNSASFIATVRW